MSTQTLINQMSRSQDWAKLVRFSIANRLNRDALNAARKILDLTTVKGSYADQSLVFVTSLCEQPIHAWRYPDEFTLSKFPFDQMVTVGLVSLYAQALLCSASTNVHPLRRMQLLMQGLDAARTSVQAAKLLEDLDLIQFYTDLIAHAHFQLNEDDAAILAMNESIDAGIRLLEVDPEHYRPLLSESYTNLSAVYEQQGQHELCIFNLREALSQLTAIANNIPITALPKLAELWRRLGNKQYRLNDFESASVSFNQAVCAAKELTALDPTAGNCLTASCLYDVAAAEFARKALECAKFSCLEAIAILRHQNENTDETWLNDLGKCLNLLGVILTDLKIPDRAVQALEEALLIRRRLQNLNSNTSDVSMTLKNLSLARHNLRDSDGSARALLEAKEVEEASNAVSSLFEAAEDLPCAEWLVNARRYFVLATDEYKDLAVQQCPDQEIAGILESILPIIGSTDNGRINVHQQVLLSRRRIPEIVLLNCLLTIPELNNVEFKESQNIALLSNFATDKLEMVALECEKVNFFESGAWIVFNIGKYYALRGELTTARRLLRRAVSLYESIPEAEKHLYTGRIASAQLSLAVVCKDLREYEEAKTLLHRVIDLRQDGAAAHTPCNRLFLGNAKYNLSTVLLNIGRLDEARIAASESLIIFQEELPGQARSEHDVIALSLDLIGVCYQKTGDLTKAAEVLRESIATWKSIYAYESQLLTDVKTLPSGVAEIRPGFVSALNHYAHVLADLGKLREAESAFIEAIGIFDKMPQKAQEAQRWSRTGILDGYGQILLLTGRRTEAAELCQRAIESAESRPITSGGIHLDKGFARASYQYLLNQRLEMEQSYGVFRILAALRQGQVSVFGKDSDFTFFENVLQVLQAKEKEIGIKIAFIIAETLSPQNVLLSLFSSDSDKLKCFCCTKFNEKARNLVSIIQESVFEAGSPSFREDKRLLKLGSDAWLALPSEIQSVLTQGDNDVRVFISADSYWTAFPWEALNSLIGGELTWVGLSKVLPRWRPLTGPSLETLSRVRIGNGIKVAAVFSPWDAVSTSPLEASLEEAKQVAKQLAESGYTIVGDSLIAGSNATKNAFMNMLRDNPSIVHYTGHGAIVDKEEVLLLKSDEIEGPVYFGRREIMEFKRNSSPLQGIFPNKPLFVLNSCLTGRTRLFGGASEDLVSTMLSEGSCCVISWPIPVTDEIGKAFGAYFYKVIIEEKCEIGEAILKTRQHLWNLFQERGGTPYWALLHLHGNSFALTR